MKSLKAEIKDSLLSYVEELTERYIQNSDLKERKSRGQFFTPKQVSSFMADLFDINKQNIKLLDPGAGVGTLSVAFCSRVLNFDKKVFLSIDAYENDPNLLPFLEKVLKKCKSELEEKGHEVKYRIFEEDFILQNSKYSDGYSLPMFRDKCELYDFVISNPPYYKLNKNSPQSVTMMELISGQPNIYALFMAISASMLKPTGEMVFITPRSFCSGLYYKKFREWFLNKVQITNIHIFESRKDIFDEDDILQENMIMKVRKPIQKTGKNKEIIISTSKDKLFSNLRKIEAEYKDVMYRKNGDILIRIPTSSLDINIQSIVEAWPYTLREIGLEISTGPVVAFRAKKYLLPKFMNEKKTAPLLWMHNIQDMKVLWPFEKNNKELAIQICDKTMPIILPVKNYVLVKRFSSKEQKRRLCAGVLLKSEFSYEDVGIENHINYIYRIKGMLCVHEAYGIAAILNTSIIDNFFRSLSGNTQVNAGDIRILPLPSLENINRIGKLVKQTHPKIGYELDNIVASVLGIEYTSVRPSLGLGLTPRSPGRSLGGNQ
ncbi:MAG TPA: hypothetical protein ENI23_12980 [bacterium]|nr:hypothetical protein [bacterium]